MSLVSLSFVGFRSLAALLAVIAVPALLSTSALAADAKRAPVTTQRAVVAPSGAELVGKLLSETTRPSDPDVPLPQPGLSRTQQPAASTPLSGPQMFGRQEDGGGVFGLKIPIPASRGGTF